MVDTAERPVMIYAEPKYLKCLLKDEQKATSLRVALSLRKSHPAYGW